MKKFKKILTWTLFVTLYLNIGWALGTYMRKNVTHTKPETICAKFLAGGWQFLSKPDTLPEKRSSILILTEQIFASILWPFYIIIVIISWLFWLIFTGGIAKLFGLG